MMLDVPAAPNGLKPRGLQIKEQKHMWGSCCKDRQIHLNWHLIFAPRPVLELPSSTNSAPAPSQPRAGVLEPGGAHSAGLGSQKELAGR
jgi:hypothetical protein